MAKQGVVLIFGMLVMFSAAFSFAAEIKELEAVYADGREVKWGPGMGGKLEKANLGVVLTAAYLYDLGPVDGSSSVAETILEKLGARRALIRDVLAVVGPSPGGQPVRRIVADAEEIARAEELRQSNAPNAEDQARAIIRRLETEGGRSVARQSLSV